MRLWTLQPEEIYRILQRDGKFRCDPGRSSYKDEKNFMRSYRWMAEQVRIRTGEFCDSPIWAWYSIAGRHTRPDLRRFGLEYRDQDHVLMEIELPADKVLLSDFAKWHGVLAGAYIFKALTEEEYWREDAWLEEIGLEEEHRLTPASYERIFDLIPGSIYRCDQIQACFAELRKENIIKVWHYQAVK